MKALIVSLLIVASCTCAQAQTMRSDTSRIVNPDHLKADSVKRGQEIYLPGKQQPDTASHKQRPKKKPVKNTNEATKPQ